VRQTFLLDENIIYHAIRGVDKHDQPDTSAVELLVAIAKICHGIFVHQHLLDAYNKALKKLRDYPPRSQAAQFFVRELLHNSLKRGFVRRDKLPPLPEAAREPPAVPREDEWIVQTALISKPILVAHDSRLRVSVKAHRAVLGLTAMDAGEALELAKSERA
jgi:hypothetical protein